MDSLLVPSSIQRIRAFLIEMAGMKVKPWASVDETLHALHATLVARRSCDIFWTSLRTLLEALAGDLKARQEAQAGTLLDNEILSVERYLALLEEIRACLARQSEDAPSFRRLAHGLSAPALGLLLLLGGVATVGCESTSLRSPGSKPDASVTAPASQPDAHPPADLARERMPGQPDATADRVPDNNPIIIVVPQPDAAVAPSTGPYDAPVTMQEILNSCGVASADQSPILSCLNSLGEAWATGVTDYLAGKSCDTVTSYLSDVEWCAQSGGCRAMPSTTPFNPDQEPCAQPVLVYLGVRFV